MVLFEEVLFLDQEGKKMRCPNDSYELTGTVVSCPLAIVYKLVLNKTRKMIYDLKFTRSANEPVIRAGVMIANFN